MESQQFDRREKALGIFHVLSDDTLCTIIGLLSPLDIGKLACVSSVFNILCDEEPLWMQLCLETHQGSLDYKGTWKQTALSKLALIKDIELVYKRPRQFPGFSSLFLYRRWYRCHVSLGGFALDIGAVERKSSVLPEEFSANYDGKKPVLLTDLMEDWPAVRNWSLDELIEKCGDSEFKVTQPHGKSVPMKMKDFAGYMNVQHDEEPLYIFDPQFGETVPELLYDYKVPSLFSDDLFSVLSEQERPAYRWLVLGPARSGASWHVDPSLTSAWNSLLRGRKRWALYPPGKVPPGVVLDVDEDDGSVNYDGPNSLQWWLDVYPHLDEADKPLECTQLAGETIYVPSGWWHCVLNIDASIAVTQNFVNVNNLEIVCMDLAPGYRHRAIARAGMIASHGQTVGQNPAMKGIGSLSVNPVFADIQRNCQPLPISSESVVLANTLKCAGGVIDKNLLLALHSLKQLPPYEDRDLRGVTHKESSMGESILRKWLRTLWVERPELQPTIWKGACLALNAGTWLHRIKVICTTCRLPPPVAQDQLPVGDGTNPVFFAGDYVIKFYIQEAGSAGAIDVLGSELEFYALLKQSASPFQNVVPDFVTSGVLYPDGEDYKAVPWDGTGDCPLVCTNESTTKRKRCRDTERNGKGRFRTKWSANHGTSKADKADPVDQLARLWPYLVTKRCPGQPLSDVRESMAENNVQSLATFLGKYVRFLHTLPLPVPNDQSEKSFGPESVSEEQLRSREFKGAKSESESTFNDEYSTRPRNGTSPMLFAAAITSRQEPVALVDTQWEVPKAWSVFVSFLREQRKSVCERLKEWGSLPDHLLTQVETYLPKDPVVLIGNIEVLNGVVSVSTPPVWLHMDLMADNILMEEVGVSTLDSGENPADRESNHPHGKLLLSDKDDTIQPRYILDYGDIYHGDSLYDLLPLHFDVFNLEGRWLECFLESYRLPLSSSSPKGIRHVNGAGGAKCDRQHTLSYCAMCYCLLHEVDVMSSIFKLRQDVRTAESFEEIERQIWGCLNTYVP